MRWTQVIRRSLTLHIALAFIATGLLGFALFASSRLPDWHELMDPRHVLTIDIVNQLETSASAGESLADIIASPTISNTIKANPKFGFIFQDSKANFEYNKDLAPKVIEKQVQDILEKSNLSSDICQNLEFSGFQDKSERYSVQKRECRGKTSVTIIFGVEKGLIYEENFSAYETAGEWLSYSGIDGYAFVALAVLLYVSAAILWVRHVLGKIEYAPVQFLVEGPLCLLPEEKVPLEFLPLVRAINTIGLRAQNILQGQKFFLSAAAHELRTPLTIMRLRAEELPDHSAKHEIINDIRNLSGLMNGLLEFMRVSQLEANFSLIDLVKVCTRAIGQASEAASNADVTVALVREDDVARIELEGVEDLMVLALFNVLNNAISFSRAGDTVTVTLTSDARICVSDEGPGLSPSLIADIGEPFRKFPSDRAGAGLGLSIVQRVMSLHGGTLRAHNRAEKGALVVLDLSASLHKARQAQ